MGLLVDGNWQDTWYETAESGGHFERDESSFRDWVRAAPDSPFPAAEGRYHLYVSLACPWAHRTLIVRKLKGLEALIGVSVVHPFMGREGWSFQTDAAATGDRLGDAEHMHQIYTRAKADFTGRVTVPVLWDKVRGTIVSNESSEIIRMLNDAFGAWARPGLDLYPEALRGEIDALNTWIYQDVNNGVYRCGFATTQAAYEQAYGALFAALDRLEAHLEGRSYLVGEQLTEADIRLFTTLVRFDPVYHGHFKCNRQLLSSFPNLWRLTRRIYQTGGVAETVNFDHIKRHYYGSHDTINPTGVVPCGPQIDYDAPL